MNEWFINLEKVGACRGAVEKSCVTFYILAYLSKCKEWLHFPDYSNKSLSIYLIHTWTEYGGSHGTAFTVYLLCCKWRNESRRSNCGAGLSSNKLHCTESVHGISTQYTVYSIHTTTQTGLARASPPAGPPLCTGCMQSSTLEQRLNHNSVFWLHYILHLSYTHIHAFKG